jgi:hypothetical protein
MQNEISVADRHIIIDYSEGATDNVNTGVDGKLSIGTPHG